MLDSLLHYIESESLFHPKERILLAVSGGVDSAVMAELFHRAGFSFAIAHCNFQLRGEESQRDELFVRSMAKRLGVPFFVEQFDTAGYARKNKLSIQVAARELRYAWFDRLLKEEGYDHLATAHHLDDQVETFLINLARGTGIAGLHGILPRQGRIIRPLLFSDRADIEKFASDNQIAFIEDSSNKSLRYTRNRIRHKIIPQLEKINPSIRQSINESIARIRDVESIYNSIIEREKSRLLAKSGSGIQIPIDELKKLSPGRTWLFELLSDFGFTSPVVSDIYQALDGQPGKVFHSPDYSLTKDRDHLLILPRNLSDGHRSEYAVYPAADESSPTHLQFDSLPADKVKITADTDIAYFDQDLLRFPLYIRKWKKGDHFFPFGMKGRKKLSDFFVDIKLSIPEKKETWLLCSGEEIVWVIGKRIDDRFKVTVVTRNVLQVRWVR